MRKLKKMCYYVHAAWYWQLPFQAPKTGGLSGLHAFLIMLDPLLCWVFHALSMTQLYKINECWWKRFKTSTPFTKGLFCKRCSGLIGITRIVTRNHLLATRAVIRLSTVRGQRGGNRKYYFKFIIKLFIYKGTFLNHWN